MSRLPAMVTVTLQGMETEMVMRVAALEPVEPVEPVECRPVAGAAL